jgi:nucleotide-binding universal stress UspA family protein
MTGHILVPTDFSATADRALDVALGLAKKFNSKLTLVHAYYVPPTAYDVAVPWPLEELANNAQRELDAALAKLKREHPNCNAVLCVGAPAERIVETARERGSDMIVMGTQGRTGLRHFLLGSVAERVVRTSPVPVLTVPISHEPEPETPRPAPKKP